MVKKAQSQIITTVLIILLVLAAIVIVWQVVSSTVRGGAEDVQTQSNCLGLSLVVVKADATASTVTIRREPGAPEQEGVEAILFVNGENQGNLGMSLNQLDTGNGVATTLVAGDEVQVAAKLADGTLCPLSPITKAIA